MAVTIQQQVRMERLHRSAVRLSAVSFLSCILLGALGIWVRASLPADPAAAMPRLVALGGIGMVVLLLASGGTAITSLYCVTLSALGPGGRGIQKKHIVVGVLLVPFGVIAATAMSRVLGG